MAARELVKRANADAAYRATAAQTAPLDADPFREGELVVYPPHGVGKVDRIGSELIGGHTLELIQISFADNRMTLRIPTAQARAAGLRKLATPAACSTAMTVLSGRQRAGKLAWLKRRQIYMEKINSGDLLSIAEVARDLHGVGNESTSNFSQRTLFELAVDRLATELAAVTSTEKTEAQTRIVEVLRHAAAEREATADDAAPSVSGTP